jgi:hypothetical protein
LDAIGVCKVCGRGTCVECKVAHQGVIHCKACVEAGRFYGGGAPPFAAPATAPAPAPSPPPPPPPRQLKRPEPQGPPSATLFKLGGAGAVSAGALCLLNAAAFPYIRLLPGMPQFALAGLGAALAIVQLLFAMGVHGLHRNWGSPFAGGAAMLLAMFSALFPLLLGVGYAGAGTSPVYAPAVYAAYAIEAAGLAAAGFAIRQAAPYLPDERAALDGGAMLGVGGGLLALFSFFAAGSALCTPPGWVVAAAGFFMARKFFRGAPMPGGEVRM